MTDPNRKEREDDTHTATKEREQKDLTKERDDDPTEEISSESYDYEQMREAES